MNGVNDDCRRFEHLYDTALRGELNEEESASLERHLQSCPDCASTLPIMSALADAWGSQDEPRLDPRLEERVRARLLDEDPAARREASPGTPRRRKRPRAAAIAVAAAAAVVAAVVAGGLLELDAVEEEPSGRSARAPGAAEQEDHGARGVENEAIPCGTATSLDGRAILVRGESAAAPVLEGAVLARGDLLEVEKGGELEVELSGATLSAEGGAVFRLPERGAATVELRRGVLLAVVSRDGSSDPFAVETPAGSIEVTGTVFCTSVAANAEAYVQVAEGTVIVRDRADERNVLAVEAGEAFRLDWSEPSVESLSAERQEDLLARAGRTRPGPDAVVEEGPTREIETRPPKGREHWERLLAEALELRRARRTSEALKTYERIARRAPFRDLRAEARFTRGQLAFSLGDYETARRDLGDHAELFDDTPYDRMARVYLERIDEIFARNEPR
ncbi:MAG: FecR domain-containing protein [Polyangia bacterium]